MGMGITPTTEGNGMKDFFEEIWEMIGPYVKILVVMGVIIIFMKAMDYLTQ
jgi:hypothetical protein